MTIKLTKDEFWEQLKETDDDELQWDPSDDLDIVCKFDTRISQGWWREIELREELWLTIDRHRPTDRLMIVEPEEAIDAIYCVFMLSGKGQMSSASTSSEVSQTAGKYHISSNGVWNDAIVDYSDVEPCSFVEIGMQPSILRSFTSSSTGELPETLQHLIKSPDEAVYVRHGDTQPKMINALQEVVNCPYQGLVKRAYLEGKVIELIALVLDHEVTVQQGEKNRNFLKPEQLEKVHYAREILLRDLGNPPTLEQLAHQTGLNEFLLRQGFRQAFGTTVFGQLQAHRLELAKQLLAEQDPNVGEVAHRVGYISTSYFSRAFKRKFGMGPKAYQKRCR
ncbi:MAG: AraC family transcriptional regulator [Cyanobacteria bacterium P01_B01_bin.77]